MESNLTHKNTTRIENIENERTRVLSTPLTLSYACPLLSLNQNQNYW